jgi:hypothetical protein
MFTPQQLKCIMSKLGCPSEEDVQFAYKSIALESVLAAVRASKVADGSSSSSTGIPQPPPLASHFPADTNPEVRATLQQHFAYV